MDKYVELTAQVISNFVANQHVTTNELPQLINDTYKALWDAGNPTPQFEPEIHQRRGRRSRIDAMQHLGNTPIADEREAIEALGEAAANDELIPGGELVPESENVVGNGWQENELTGEKTPPQPMFD